MSTELPCIKKQKYGLKGFDWGNGGGGERGDNLALSILSHYCKMKGKKASDAKKLYESFKRDFIVPAGNKLSIHCYEIAEWMKKQ